MVSYRGFFAKGSINFRRVDTCNALNTIVDTFSAAKIASLGAYNWATWPTSVAGYRARRLFVRYLTFVVASQKLKNYLLHDCQAYSL